MGRGPRRISSGEDLYAAAVGALARRAYSVLEMRRYLDRRAGDRELASPVLARLRAEGLVDDARYARQFARDRLANRRQGRFRIVRELQARGVADRYIEAALEELGPETDVAATIRRRIQSWLRRHSVADPATLDRRRIASLYHSLLRAGFPGDRIRTELHRLGRPAETLPPEHSSEE